MTPETEKKLYFQHWLRKYWENKVSLDNSPLCPFCNSKPEIVFEVNMEAPPGRAHQYNNCGVYIACGHWSCRCRTKICIGTKFTLITYDKEIVHAHYEPTTIRKAIENAIKLWNRRHDTSLNTIELESMEMTIKT